MFLYNFSHFHICLGFALLLEKSLLQRCPAALSTQEHKLGWKWHPSLSQEQGTLCACTHLVQENMQTLVSWIKHHLLWNMGADTHSYMCIMMPLNRRGTRNATIKEFKFLNIQIKFVLESVTSFPSRLLPRCSLKEHFANSDKYNSLYWTQKLYSTELSKQCPIARRNYLVAIAYTFFFFQSVSLYLPTLVLGKIPNFICWHAFCLVWSSIILKLLLKKISAKYTQNFWQLIPYY